MTTISINIQIYTREIIACRPPVYLASPSILGKHAFYTEQPAVTSSGDVAVTWQIKLNLSVELAIILECR